MDSEESDGVTKGFDETASTEYVILCDKVDVNHFGSQFIPASYYTIFLFSLLGNGLVLYTMYKYEKLNTVTNIFLINLVVSNLVFSSSLPFWATYHFSSWVFGSALCKLVGAVFFVGFYCSILFLMLMTIDRYLTVVHPVSTSKQRKNAYALICSAVVWCVSILANVKEFVVLDVIDSEDSGWLCEETEPSIEFFATWKVIGDYQNFVLFFLLPLAVILYCYARIIMRIMQTRLKTKYRTVKIIFVTIIMFFACWTPYNVVVLLRALLIEDADECSQHLDYALYITRNISYLYFCVNPVFYTFLGKKFRNHFYKLLAKHSICLHNQLISQSSKTSSQRSMCE